MQVVESLACKDPINRFEHGQLLTRTNSAASNESLIPFSFDRVLTSIPARPGEVGCPEPLVPPHEDEKRPRACGRAKLVLVSKVQDVGGIDITASDLSPDRAEIGRIYRIVIRKTGTGPVSAPAAMAAAALRKRALSR